MKSWILPLWNSWQNTNHEMKKTKSFKSRLISFFTIPFYFILFAIYPVLALLNYNILQIRFTAGIRSLVVVAVLVHHEAGVEARGRAATGMLRSGIAKAQHRHRRERRPGTRCEPYDRAVRRALLTTLSVLFLLPAVAKAVSGSPRYSTKIKGLSAED